MTGFYVIIIDCGEFLYNIYSILNRKSEESERGARADCAKSLGMREFPTVAKRVLGVGLAK